MIERDLLGLCIKYIWHRSIIKLFIGCIFFCYKLTEFCVNYDGTVIRHLSSNQLIITNFCVVVIVAVVVVVVIIVVVIFTCIFLFIFYHVWSSCFCILKSMLLIIWYKLGNKVLYLLVSFVCLCLLVHATYSLQL